MNMQRFVSARWLAASLLALCGLSFPALATVSGVQGPTFNLSADSAYIATPDGGSVWIWAYRDQSLDATARPSAPQYPGPTMIVQQGDSVTVNLSNALRDGHNTSIVFPGQLGVLASGGVAGPLTREAEAGGSVTYTFVAGEPGTYLYHSGSDADLQVEMGLFGALIVRPAGAANQAYSQPETAFDREYLFLLSEMDPRIHQLADAGQYDQIDFSDYFSTLWFINGRNGPDSMSADNLPWMPHQPYGALARMHPGEQVLARVIGAGRQTHPFHMHGNHARIIARDGRALSSGAGMGLDLSREDYTLQSYPGSTYDVLWTWTGEKLGWDIYGTPAEGRDHTCVDNSADGFDDLTHEYCADHYKPIPVVLPENQDLAFGGFYSGSAFLGGLGNLPPGEGGLNVYGGMFYMWHSHTEKELTNNDIFPGGMMTMMIVEPPEAPIE